MRSKYGNGYGMLVIILFCSCFCIFILICGLPSMIRDHLTSINTPTPIISKEFTLNKYGNTYTIRGKIANKTDSDIYLDSLTFYTNSTKVNGKNHSAYFSIGKIIIPAHEELEICEENLTLKTQINGHSYPIQNNVYYSSINDIRCDIDGQSFKLSSTENIMNKSGGIIIWIVCFIVTGATSAGIIIYFYKKYGYTD